MTLHRHSFRTSSRMPWNSASYVALLNPAYEGGAIARILEHIKFNMGCPLSIGVTRGMCGAVHGTGPILMSVISSSSTQVPSEGCSQKILSMILFVRRRCSYEMCSCSRSSVSETCDICDPGMVSSNAEVRIAHERGEKMIGKDPGA